MSTSDFFILQQSLQTQKKKGEKTSKPDSGRTKSCLYLTTDPKYTQQRQSRRLSVVTGTRGRVLLLL